MKNINELKNKYLPGLPEFDESKIPFDSSDTIKVLKQMHKISRTEVLLYAGNIAQFRPVDQLNIVDTGKWELCTTYLGYSKIMKEKKGGFHVCHEDKSQKALWTYPNVVFTHNGELLELLSGIEEYDNMGSFYKWERSRFIVIGGKIPQHLLLEPANRCVLFNHPNATCLVDMGLNDPSVKRCVNGTGYMHMMCAYSSLMATIKKYGSK